MIASIKIYRKATHLNLSSYLEMLEYLFIMVNKTMLSILLEY